MGMAVSSVLSFFLTIYIVLSFFLGNDRKIVSK